MHNNNLVSMFNLPRLTARMNFSLLQLIQATEGNYIEP